MKKHWFTAIFLIVALILFLSPFVSAATMTETQAAQKGADVFQAWYVINKTNYKYMTTDYQGPCRMYVDDLKKNGAFNAELAAWRVATFDLKSEYSYVEKEIGYYDAFIFNILYDESSESLGTSFIGDLNEISGDIEKNWKKISASTWKKLSELDNTIKNNPKLNKDNIDVTTQNFLKNLGNNQDVYDAMSLIGELTDYLGYCSTALDLVEKVSKIQALLDQSKEVVEIFQDMANASTDNLLLKASLKDYTQYISGQLSKEEIALIFSGQTLLDEAAKKLASKAWSSLLDVLAGEYKISIQAGQALGKFGADFLANSSSVIGKYYKLDAMCQFEDVLLAETLSCQRAFENNPTPASAKKFIAAYQMLYKTYLESLDCSDSFVKTAFEEGWINRVRRLMGDNEYESVLRSIESLKSSVSFTLDYYETLSYNYYVNVLNDSQDDAVVMAIADVGLSTVENVPISPEIQMAEIQTQVTKFSNVEYSANKTLSDDLVFYGSLKLSGGTLDLNGHNLTVHGDLEQTGGTMFINGGTLNIGGDYVLASSYNRLSDGGLELVGGSEGYLKMTNDADEVNVSGNFGTKTYRSHSGYLTAGTLRIKGNFYQNYYSSQDSYRNFLCTGTHTVIFNGEGTQHISFASTISGFKYVNFENPHIQLDSSVKAFTINEDIYLTIGTNSFGVDGTLDLKHCLNDFTFDRAFTFTEGTLVLYDHALNVKDSLTVNGNLRLGTKDLTIGKNLNVNGSLTLNGHDLAVPGNIVLSSGTIDLNGSEVSVSGSVKQTGGTMFINGGTLNIGGDYVLASSYNRLSDGGLELVGGSEGYLKMTNDADTVNVSGNFGTKTLHNHNGYLTAGTLRIKGNFYQKYYSGSDSDRNFLCTGTHTVVLNGNAVQKVYFDSSSSHFNRLQITQPLTQYVFNSEPCWNTLVEASSELPQIEVSSVTLSARTLTLTAGKETALTAAILPADATNKTLVWTSSDESVATVGQNGVVTAVEKGTAVIQVTASNGLYRTCTVTVQEIFSGILSVGTVSALPGEEIAVPVIAWDNPGFAAIRVTVSYDADILTPKEVRVGDKLSADNLSFEDHSGSLNILWYDSEDMKSDGILFYMVFQVSDGAALDTETPIGLQAKYGDICMADHTNLSFSTENGSLLIRDVLKGDIYEDGVVDVHDILPLQRYLTKLDALNGRQMVAADLTGDGNVDMKDIIKLAQTLLADSNLLTALDNTLRVPSSDFAVCVEDAVFDTDGYVTVPVTFSGCPGMAAFRLRVDYDETLLDLVSLEAVSELVRENICDNLSDMERDATWVTWYSANDQMIDGPAFTLRFKLHDPAFRGIIPTSIEICDNDVCTAGLLELSPSVQYGIVHSTYYTSDVQISDVSISENNKAITGTIVCGRKVNGIGCMVVAAFYDNYGRMLSTWTNTLCLENNSQFYVEGDIDSYSSIKLFVIKDGEWFPLCPAVENHAM